MKLSRAWIVLAFIVFSVTDTYAIGEWCQPFRIAYTSVGSQRIDTWIQNLRDKTIATIDHEAKFEQKSAPQSSKDVLTELMNGTVALGVISVASLTKLVPAVMLLDFPGLVTDSRGIKQLYDGRRYLNHIQEQLKPLDLTLLGIVNVPYTLLSAKELTIPDLKGAKIHTPSTIQVATIKAFGALPVRFSRAQLYAGLSTQTVTGALLPMSPVTGLLKRTKRIQAAMISPVYSRNIVLIGSNRFLQRANDKAKLNEFVDLAAQTSLEYNTKNTSAIESLIKDWKKIGWAVSSYSTEQAALQGKVKLPDLWSKLVSGKTKGSYVALKKDLGM